MTTIPRSTQQTAGARRSFSKMAPDVRRQQLIDATFACLVRSGPSDTTVRSIAQEAGLSLGMVRHHFHSKDELFAATLRHLSDQMQVEIAGALERSGPDPTERFQAFVAACLGPPALDADYVRARFHFLGLAQSNETVRRVHDEIYARFEGQVRGLIAAIAEANEVEVDLQVTTLTILALMKGVWVEWSLAPDRVDPRKLVMQILPALKQTME